MVSAEETARRLPFDALVAALRAGFFEGAEAPLRHQHRVGTPDAEATLLVMPAWSARYVGVKLVNVFPHNGAAGLPAVNPVYVLSSATTGAALAVVDGAELTRRRTAAASALAAAYLAREDARHLLVVGAGKVAEVLPAAYRAVRPIERVSVWNRTASHADALVTALRTDGFEADRVDELAPAVATADVVSCATLASRAVVSGRWLRPGIHLDLIGSFAPHLRETDDEALRRATVFIDTQDALAESGDLLGPVESGTFAPADVAGTLYDLARGRHAGRTGDEEITLFKSVGTALEDLAAAALVYESLT